MVDFLGEWRQATFSPAAAAHMPFPPPLSPRFLMLMIRTDASVGPLRREEARRSSETRLFPLHRLRLLELSYEKVLSHEGILHHVICPKGGTV